MKNSSKPSSKVKKTASGFFKYLIILALITGIVAGFLFITNKIVNFTTKTNDYLSVVDYLKGNDKPVKNLILLSNNAEQRYGSGFIGSVGVIGADKSKFDIEPIHSVYFYDHNLENKPTIYPIPQELKAITGYMALRDSAIFANWPDSARLAAKFFKEEANVEVDNVISVTPQVLKEILKITGPIYLEEYKKTVSSDNFLESVQLEVEAGSDKKANRDPKTILGNLGNKVIEKTLNQDLAKTSNFYDQLKRMIEEKQIVVYSFNQNIQKKIEKLNLSGELNEASGNYLLVTGTNVGGNKSSPFIEQKIDQKLTIDESGEAKVNLKITRTHTSDFKYPYFDPNDKQDKWLIGPNINYSKVFVPYGSELISADISKDNVVVSSENNKTIYSFWLNTQPKQTKSVEIVYKLPFEYQIGEELVVKNIFDKQIGGFNDKITQKIIVPNSFRLKKVSTDKYFYTGDNEVEYDDILNTDKKIIFTYDRKN
ncbi:MAG: DUF4012 domain-containing protein [bacterium]|nr:DUF4012 domain-containing protein [bacterium]